MNTRADFLSCSTPLTEAQEGLWNMQARDPRNPILNTGLYLDPVSYTHLTLPTSDLV